MKPLNDLISIQIIEEEKKTSSGLIIPKDVHSRIAYAKVIEVGDKVQELQKGDIIIFDKNIIPNKVTDEQGNEISFINENLVFAKINN